MQVLIISLVVLNLCSWMYIAQANIRKKQKNKKANIVKPLSKLNKKEFKERMKDLEIK